MLRRSKAYVLRVDGYPDFPSDVLLHVTRDEAQKQVVPDHVVGTTHATINRVRVPFLDPASVRHLDDAVVKQLDGSPLTTLHGEGRRREGLGSLVWWRQRDVNELSIQLEKGVPVPVPARKSRLSE